jgi:hypothetical protein
VSPTSNLDPAGGAKARIPGASDRSARGRLRTPSPCCRALRRVPLSAMFSRRLNRKPSNRHGDRSTRSLRAAAVILKAAHIDRGARRARRRTRTMRRSCSGLNHRDSPVRHRATIAGSARLSASDRAEAETRKDDVPFVTAHGHVSGVWANAARVDCVAPHDGSGFGTDFASNLAGES